MFHFINFKYSLENSKEVILYFCKRYELDQSRTHLLLSELESAQNQAHLVLTQRELSLISKNKIQKRIDKSDHDTKLMILALVLKFIPTSAPSEPMDSELKTFLLLNKKSSELLSKQVYKQALIYEIYPDKLTKKRIFLWKKQL